MPRHQQRGGKSQSPPGASQRQLRVSELVRHALAEIFTQGDLHEPDLAGRIITVPEVKMSPDLKLATAYIMPLGGEGAIQVVAALDRHKKFLRGEVAHRINMKFSPDLRFRVDDRFDEAARIERLLKTPDVARDLDPSDDHEDK